MSDQTRKRPGEQTGATSKKNSVGVSSGSKYTDLAARARRHDHGVLVLATRKDGIVTSQVFADLAAAERKVWRTRERGLSASLTLVRIVPVPHVALDELEGGERR
ncbi:hypothetical protein ACTHQ1_05095 [Janibacter anophelis]|uniref:hypothetical protein n=1 Tax=Janibacter anophelis TaxID=319054 RepID=UPI003F7CE5BB